MLLQKYFETRLEMIEASLKHQFSPQTAPAKELKKAMRYSTFPGGKRWRPLLLVSIYEMLTGMKKNKGLPEAVKAATAVEIAHNASLVHDDLPMLMNKTERRSEQALHLKYDNTVGILAGDALYALAFEVLGGITPPSKALACIRILSTSTRSYGLIGGQAVALESQHRVMKLNTLRYIDTKKLGSLLQAAADMACVLAGAQENIRQIMNSYALNLALAYRMIEDISKDYNRGSEGLDFDEELIPVSKTSYTGFLGFDKARAAVDKLLDESERMISPFENTDVLREFIQMIKERLP
ncbi:MAG: polyprenyl synthetase family protein [Candidatus Cloacimonetes bacterium]|nr:polyprenyl synthetase family protein [Candidatus Cloacimonadota bacterium]MDD4224427.1 polyprenyl synthetase family protein [Candidatus Cloacimonadota bacterium]